MRDGDSPLMRRLLVRSEDGLQRRAMPGGGEAFSGELATQALRSVGARAMTYDGAIFVAEDFNSDNPEDVALYAHELQHQVNRDDEQQASADYGNDPAEVLARRVEGMVLHRAESGDGFADIMRDVAAGSMHQNAAVARTAISGRSAGGDPTPTDAEAAYVQLQAQGMRHDQIVDMLAQSILSSMREQESTDTLNGHKGGFL